jgi:hypothetical protein
LNKGKQPHYRSTKPMTCCHCLATDIAAQQDRPFVHARELVRRNRTDNGLVLDRSFVLTMNCQHARHTEALLTIGEKVSPVSSWTMYSLSEVINSPLETTLQWPGFTNNRLISTALLRVYKLKTPTVDRQTFSQLVQRSKTLTQLNST